MAEVSETLDALERKLRELERELGSSALDPPPAAERPLAPPASGGGDLDDLARQIDDLARFREQLQRIGRELEEEYARVIARLGGSAVPERPGPITRDPSVPPGQGPGPSPAEPETPVTVQETLVLDAGPFADLAALGSFEETLAALPGVVAADVTGFVGRRAQFDLSVAGPVALADELTRAVPGAVIRPTDEPDRLAVDLEPAP